MQHNSPKAVTFQILAASVSHVSLYHTGVQEDRVVKHQFSLESEEYNKRESNLFGPDFHKKASKWMEVIKTLDNVSNHGKAGPAQHTRSHLRIFWPEVLQLSMEARKLDTSTTHAAHIYTSTWSSTATDTSDQNLPRTTPTGQWNTRRRQSDPEYDHSLFQTTRYQPFTHACCSLRLGTVADGVTTGGLWSERERQCNKNHLELLQYIIGAVPAAPCGQSDSCVLHQPHGSTQIPCSVA